MNSDEEAITIFNTWLEEEWGVTLHSAFEWIYLNSKLPTGIDKSLLITRNGS